MRNAIVDWANGDLSPACVVTADGLACFAGVTDAGCQHRAIIAGGRKPKDLPEFNWINTVCEIYDGIQASEALNHQRRVPICTQSAICICEGWPRSLYFLKQINFHLRISAKLCKTFWPRVGKMPVKSGFVTDSNLRL